MSEVAARKFREAEFMQKLSNVDADLEKWATECRKVVLSLFLSLRLQSKESSCGDRSLEIKMA